MNIRHHEFVQRGVGYYTFVVCKHCGVPLNRRSGPCDVTDQARLVLVGATDIKEKSK